MSTSCLYSVLCTAAETSVSSQVLGSLSVCLSVCLCLSMSMYVCMYLSFSLSTHMRTHAHARARAHTHTHTHTHTLTYPTHLPHSVPSVYVYVGVLFRVYRRWNTFGTYNGQGNSVVHFVTYFCIVERGKAPFKNYRDTPLHHGL